MNQDANRLVGEIRRERANRAWVRGWLYVVAALILAIVMVGGATRLTDSGLSITEWKPIHGVIPPLTEAEWQEEFAKYRQIPEFSQINPDMTSRRSSGGNGRTVCSVAWLAWRSPCRSRSSGWPVCWNRISSRACCCFLASAARRARSAGGWSLPA
jgi:hypothetical protein